MKLTNFLCALKNDFEARERRRYRPRLELLEDRVVPIIMVTNTLDALVPPPGSLRAAMIAANATAAADTITFDIPPTGSGVQTINLVAALPTLVYPTTIAGNSQPGFTNAPLIELNGAGAGGAHGLILNAPNCTVRSLIP